MTCKNQGNFITHLTMAIDELEYPISVTRLGNFSKYLATNKLPKSPTFLGNFCNGVKKIIFSSEIIFRQIL